jgi:SPP1 family phage portal protein
MQLELQRLIDVAVPEEKQIFKDSQLETLNRLIKYADYYDNDVFKYIEAEYPEYGHSIVRNKSVKPAQIPFNYARWIINKLASWQFEIPIDFNATPDGDVTDKVEQDLYELHKQNKMDSKLYQAAVEANKSGGVVFKLAYDTTGKRLKIHARPRMECFPITEFDDYETINKVHFVAFKDEKTIWKQTYELVDVLGKKVCYIEEAEYDTRNIQEPSRVIIEYQPLGINGKWLDFIPVYIVPNTPQIGEVWGMSELEDLVPLIDAINMKYSDLSDSLRFDMFAITILLNTGKLDSTKVKPGAVWELIGGDPQGAMKPEIFKLESQFQYIESLKYLIDNLESAIIQFSETIDLNIQKIEGLGNLSGVALKLMFAAILSKTARKNMIWGDKLREMYLGMLKMLNVYEGYDIPDEFDLEILFHDPLPQNELEQVQILSAKIADGLIALSTAMDEIGIQDPEAEIAKILEERKTFESSYIEQAQKKNEVNNG